jgi:transaldolase
MIKIPATDAGLEAIATVIGDGISVNVTLIFGIPRYLQVVAAHQKGIESLAKREQDRLPHVASVASFFISRVDNVIDPLIANTGLPLGRTAIAQAKLAYREFARHVTSPEWTSVANHGAQAQRPLWASTSTKNPAFSPTLYVDELIGPNTVNTLPDATLEAFDRSGTVARTIDTGFVEAEGHLRRVAEAGVNVDEIARQLETDGLKSFQASFDDLLAALASKATAH